MPAGTDAVALHRAARDFAKNEFSDYQYALVLHTLENDPNWNPSGNPHVHLCVKMRGIDGVPLNPRKNDLRRWREQFAERLREHGVEAEATSRSARFQPIPGKRQAVYHQSKQWNRNKSRRIRPPEDPSQGNIRFGEKYVERLLRIASCIGSIN